MLRVGLSILILLCVMMMSVLAFAKVPEYYSILTDPSNIPPVEPAPAAEASPWNPSEADIERGFAAYCVDTTDRLTPSWLWSEPAPASSLEFFIYRGQFKPMPIAVRTLAELRGLNIECSALRDAKGNIIPKEYTDIRSIVYTPRTVENHKSYSGKWIRQRLYSQLPKDYTTWIWITFHADKNTPAGLYKGTLTLSDYTKKRVLKMPVKMLVPDITVNPQAGSFGYYIPGHFHRQNEGMYKNYAEPNFVAKNIDLYFRFWKTRNLTSPTFYHVYPGLSCIDEHAHSDFSELGRMVEAAKQAGLTGDICVDMRWVEWWSNVASNTLDSMKLANKSTAGDIGIYGPDGWYGQEYSDGAKRLVTETAVQLKEKAEQENWPRLLVLAEEELAGDLIKRGTFEQFTPILQKIFPDTTYIVDNSIGYSGRSVDRGEMFNVKIRQYNNWTEEGLAAAKKDKAQVRSYNYGWSRCTWGFLQTRLGSDSHHQWADMWYGVDEQNSWSANALSEKGITTSVDTEVSHEGLDDLAYVQTLLSLAKQKGTAVENKYKKLVNDIVSDIPVNAMIYHPWLGNIKNSEFEQRRWELALAINEISGKKGYLKAAAGSPKLLGTWQIRNEVKAPDLILGAPRIAEDMAIDGSAKESVWSNPKSSTGSLKWLWNKEAQLLAEAGAQGRDNIVSPSATHARFAYGADGLYILSQCNHTTLENARADRHDDDPELWMDDCMEYFFETNFGSNEYYHLIVNPKGAHVLIYTSDIVKDTGIKTASVNLNNPTGGYAQEVFIPWSALGLNEIPKQGTMWRMNVAREFNSWNQLMSWGRVDSQFAEIDRWGMIVFEGEQGKVGVDELNVGPGFPGINSVSGKITPSLGWNAEDISLRIVDAENKEVTRQNLSLERWKTEPFFNVEFSIPHEIQPQMWQLLLTDTAGEKLGSVSIPVRSEKSSVDIISCPRKVISGTHLCVQARVNIGDVSLKNNLLEATLVSSYGKQVKLEGIPMAKSDTQRVWIQTNGLEPGNWKLFLVVKGTASPSEHAIFTVLPCPTAE